MRHEESCVRSVGDHVESGVEVAYPTSPRDRPSRRVQPREVSRRSCRDRHSPSCTRVLAPAPTYRRLRPPAGQQVRGLRRRSLPNCPSGHHRRLARDRIAKHGEALSCPHRERVEAIQIFHAGARAPALAVAPLAHTARSRQPSRHLSVVLGSERDALTTQHPAAAHCDSIRSRCGPGRESSPGRRTDGSLPW